MSITKKMLGTVAAGVAVALTLAGCSGEAATDENGNELKPVDVNFGYIADYNGTSLLAIAEDQGLWEKHGVNITTTSFTNGPLQIQALGTGDLDFGYIGPGAFWLPASGQAKLVSMNTLGQADRVVAQPGIESMEDLRGKTVAVPEGTSGDMILTLALEEAGMTKDDIKVVNMEPAAIVSALASKKVDGAGFWYPALATVKEQVPGLIELAENKDFEDTVAFPTAFVAGNDLVENEPEKLERVLGVLREAIDYRAKNVDESIQLTAEFSALDPEQVKADAGNVQILGLDEIDKLTKDGTVNEWLESMNNYFVEAGKLPEPVEPSEYYTGDLFLKAGK
ncbi:aliphatic sulfonate ABC transporter substrate-binding protein [Paramicrobacterium agarici]|uniref:NitT/TauT family transport system substrate-binding protein n=1 Tax=Paramicrobacterium agarici TaxID=630514 RepID=A0A2A9DVV0_9MICO|nr:aliphatic sulfonate ABC transporter substrate-binding protein [Microbacterium agarici]PFG30070.1 NitT/TauT family transport system substrate-binding protein [Microbacterium agarici]TQO23076.1 NitT/TauT family transport system substrate-binding protein [Microbacterium agarici]